MTVPVCAGYTTSCGWRCSTPPTPPCKCAFWVSSREINTRFPLLLRESQDSSLGSSYVNSRTGTSYTFFFSVSISKHSSSNSQLLKACWNFKKVYFKSALWPVDKLETTANWLKQVNQNRLLVASKRFVSALFCRAKRLISKLIILRLPFYQ